MNFDISNDEFEKTRTAFELTDWLREKFKQIDLTGKFSEVYYERGGHHNVKKLIEEAFPVSRLALHLSTPYQEVKVRLLTGSQNFDAEMEILPFRNPEKPDRFKVEVSTTEDEENNMRRELLSKEGCVPLMGKISKDKGVIHAEEEFVELIEFEESLTKLLFDRFISKVKSDKYDENTVLLIYLAQMHPLSIRLRASLIHEVQQFIKKENPNIKDVYFSYCFANVVDSVKFYEW